ncbi:rhomboid family intramembrane serine protease [Paenibacillus eucommiae]|uniref:Membrane associated rhomboid family serine protease n=1 Tax=Paenibacillus eucommiae TaxID=1355755 RepID=A0ABS4IS29_9BACL|nr:rhomboid family intramembrane serine protease [Paenibacillus eucommiae]MBP1990350.1 membrane associated rhomboid family serine protease [Paenibacillus eucommiae]
MFVRTESFKQYIRLYPITSLLILANIVMLILMEISGSSQESITLLKFGALFDLPDIQPEAWRYVSAIFLHIGVTHLLFNCFALCVFAPPLELMLGKWRYALLYVVCGIFGNLMSQWMHKDYFVSAGASGAIFGIYGAYLFLALFRKDIIDSQTKKTIATIIGVGFISSIVVPNVDLYAHLGGFIGGLVVMALISLSIRRRYRKRMEAEQRFS